MISVQLRAMNTAKDKERYIFYIYFKARSVPTHFETRATRKWFITQMSYNRNIGILSKARFFLQIIKGPDSRILVVSLSQHRT